MKNIKKFEQFLKENKDLSSKVPTYSESDAYIAYSSNLDFNKLFTNIVYFKSSSFLPFLFLVALNI